MGRKGWPTPAQRKLLLSFLDDFFDAQKDSTTTDFFSTTFEAFTDKFSLPKPSAKQLTKAGGDPVAAAKLVTDFWSNRIRNWYYNTARTMTATSGAGRVKVLNLRPPRKYKLSEPKAYSKKYYIPKLKQKIEPEYAKIVKDAEDAGKKPEAFITFHNRRVAQLLEEETDEVKAEIKQYVKELQAKGTTYEIREEEGDGDGDGGSDAGGAPARSVDEVNDAVNALPVTCECALEQIFKLTGFKGSICLTGDNPRGGKPLVLAVHTPGEKTWANAPGFKKDVEDRLEAFAAKNHVKKDSSTVDKDPEGGNDSESRETLPTTKAAAKETTSANSSSSSTPSDKSAPENSNEGEVTNEKVGDKFEGDETNGTHVGNGGPKSNGGDDGDDDDDDDDGDGDDDEEEDEEDSDLLFIGNRF
ncbi:hypothetical protein SCHPADRAFT_947556, partial [Schizopora paradoxa]